MPDLWMDVDTALSEVPVNIMPLLDATDFKTIEDAVAYDAAGMALYWHFVTTGGAYTVTAVTPTAAGNYDWTDQGASGIYTIEIPASGGASINNDTEGFGWFTGMATGVLPWRGPTIGFRAAGLNDVMIDSAYSTTRGLAGTALPAAAADAAGGLIISDAGGLDADAQLVTKINDILTDTGTTLDGRIPAALVGGRMDANVGAISSDATAADNAEAFFDGTGYAGTGNVIPTVTTLTNAPSDSAGVTTLLSRIPSALFSGITSLAQWLGLIAGKQTGNSTARTELRATGAGSGTFDETADSQEAIRDRGDAAWITATGFSTHSAADVWAVGTRILTANTNLNDPTAAAIADAVWDEDATAHQTGGTFGQAIGDPVADTNTIFKAVVTDATGATVGVDAAAILADTGTDGVVVASHTAAAKAEIEAEVDDALGSGTGTALTAIPWNASWDAEVQSEVQDALDATLADSVPSDGTRPSMAQAAYAIYQFLTERAVSGTTMTVKKVDGSTTLMTFTLNDATSPTSITRSG